MKGPTRKDDNLTTAQLQQKSIINRQDSKEIMKQQQQQPPVTYDEAKASCKARKRKERQESISSICQERKVIRSNSEERPIQRKYFDNKTTIRRVSSSEDFQKRQQKEIKIISLTLINEKIQTTITNQDEQTNLTNSNENILSYDDYEHERRRSHERFSKPLTLKNRKHKTRKSKIRCLSKPKFRPELTTTDKDDKIQDTNDSEIVANFLQLHNDNSGNNKDKERSPSPICSKINNNNDDDNNFTPNIDLSTLHEQVDCSEPLLSCANHQINENTETLPSLSVASNRLLSSPRNSIIATHRIYLDKNIPQTNLDFDNKTENPFELKLQKLTKQINSMKKKIKKYENEFENKHGYKVSHADKLNDKTIRKMYMDLSRLKKEQKQLLDVYPSGIVPTTIEESTIEPQNYKRSLQETLIEIEKRLTQKRELVKRPEQIDQLSNQELIDEKIAIQKALLYLESLHGRPDNKGDRNLVRPIYDRYRTLKRMISKSQPTTTGNELATIHEDETMNFITPCPQNSGGSDDVDSEKSTTISMIVPATTTTSTDSSDTDTSSLSENLHSLTKMELIEQHKIVYEEKKELKRTIKLFESDVQHKTGRMVQKEDRAPIQDVYGAYKKCRAKLKLLDALVGKQP